MKKRHSRMIDGIIDPMQVLQEVSGPTAGCTVMFVGTVRDKSEAGPVDQIVYEAYVPMAQKGLLKIDEEIRRMWPVTDVSLVHRVGKLGIGGVSVVVAVSSPHRAEAFEACRYGIERIKLDVPIWKKERLSSGREIWVEGKPGDPGVVKASKK